MRRLPSAISSSVTLERHIFQLVVMHFLDVMQNTRRFLSAASFAPEHSWRDCPQINMTTTSREGSQSKGYAYPQVLNRQGGQPALLCVVDNARAVVTRHISNFTSKMTHCHRPTQLCRRRHRCQRGFSTRSLSDASWVNAIPHVGLDAR
jgi:hypothetical protein